MKIVTEHIELALNIAINIILFIIYACLFGRQSIDKYLENGVSVINQEEDPVFDIIPPGMVGVSL